MKVGEHLQVGIEILAEAKKRGWGWDPLAPDVEERAAALSSSSARRRMPTRSDAELAAMASQYIAAVAGGSRRPIQDLARRNNTSVAAVRMAIYRARRRQPPLLTKPRQGSRGGELTAEGLRLLNRIKAKKGGRK